MTREDNRRRRQTAKAYSTILILWHYGSRGCPAGSPHRPLARTAPIRWGLCFPHGPNSVPQPGCFSITVELFEQESQALGHFEVVRLHLQDPLIRLRSLLEFTF